MLNQEERRFYWQDLGRRFLQDAERSRMAKNSAWLLVDKVLRGGGGLAVLIILGRLLGVQQYGQYGLALAVIAIFAALATVGLDGVVVRRLVENPEQGGVILGTSMGLRLTGGFMATLAAVMCISFLYREEALVPMVAWMGGALVMQAADVLDYWFQSRLLAGPVVRVRLLVFLLGAGAKIGLMLAGAPLVTLGIVVFAESILIAVGLLWQGKRHGLRFPWNWSASMPEFRIQLGLAWPLLVSGLLVALFFKLDQLLLGWFRGTRDLGLYHSALRLIELWNVLPLVILPSVFPGLVRVHAQEPAVYFRRLQRLFSLFSMMAWILMTGAMILAGGLIPFIFGPDFAGGGIVLAILAVTLHFQFSSSIRAQMMLIEGLTIYHTPIALVSLLLLMTLNLILIPAYGLPGAAVAACLSTAFSGLISSFIFPSLRHIGKMQIKALFGGFFCLKRNQV